MKSSKGTQKQTDASQQIEELNNKYLRALADYQNLEKRLSAAVEQARTQAERHTLSRFIDILDDLEKAEVFVQDQGLAMVIANFKRVFESAGVNEIEVLGQAFDPYTAEALEVVPGEEDNIVTEVVRKGYKIGENIIRPAQVKVSSTKSAL